MFISETTAGVFLKWIGIGVCLVNLSKLSYFLFKVIYSRMCKICGFTVKWKELGKWAVVTGGTDGIGKSYAEELARKGFSICLISRNLFKLEQVAKELNTLYSVSTKIIHADFTEGSEMYERIKLQLCDLEGEIGVLVNNVGMSYSHTEYLHAIPDGMETANNLIYSNTVSCTMMMKLVLPQMVKRNKGIIINVSSLTAIYPMPLLAIYAASKAYVDYLSRAASYEYKDKGVIIQCVLPGYVATKMSNRRTSLEVPSATTFVKSAIKTIGFEDRTYGYIAHSIRGFIHERLKETLPERINMAIAKHFMSKSREKYYKKAGLSN